MGRGENGWGGKANVRNMRDGKLGGEKRVNNGLGEGGNGWDGKGNENGLNLPTKFPDMVPTRSRSCLGPI